MALFTGRSKRKYSTRGRVKSRYVEESRKKSDPSVVKNPIRFEAESVMRETPKALLFKVGKEKFWVSKCFAPLFRDDEGIRYFEIRVPENKRIRLFKGNDYTKNYREVPPSRLLEKPPIPNLPEKKTYTAGAFA